MKLIIENHTLQSCVLGENEHSVILPESVHSISDNAFSQNPPGQIRHLTLPDSLRHIAAHAFSGMDRLSSLTAYTCNIENHMHREVDIQDGFPDFLRAETLILRPGKDGMFFSLDSVLLEIPRKLILSDGMDIRVGLRDARELDGDLEIEELTVCLSAERRAENLPFLDHHLLRVMSANLKKLKFINNHYRCISTGLYMYWTYYKKKIPLPPLFDLGEDWYWNPFKLSFDLYEMQALEELVLPGGLTELSAYEFSDCPSLKKVVFPVSLKTIGNGAFSRCVSLKTVLFPQDGFLQIAPSAFSGCHALRSVSVYQEILPGKIVRTGRKDATEYLGRARILRLHNQISTCIQEVNQRETDARYSRFFSQYCEQMEQHTRHLLEHPQNCNLLTVWLTRVLHDTEQLRQTIRQEASAYDSASQHDPANDQNALGGLDTLLEMLCDYLYGYRDRQG